MQTAFVQLVISTAAIPNEAIAFSKTGGWKEEDHNRYIKVNIFIV